MSTRPAAPADRPEFYAFALALVATIAIAVLAGLGHQVPTILDEVALAAGFGGAGLAVPGGRPASFGPTEPVDQGI